jgi:S1-C subfamily serine protease
MKAWGKNILKVGAVGAAGAAVGALAPTIVGSVIAGGLVGKWLGEFFSEDEFDEEKDEIDPMHIAIVGAMAKIIFHPNKRKLSVKDKSMLFQKFENFDFDEEGALLSIEIMEDVLAGEFDIEDSLVQLAPYDLKYKIARYCVATAIDDGIWSPHEARSFSRICNLMEIPIAAQAALRDNAWIIHFEKTRGIESMGSGFFINDDGVILTNQHVATEQKELFVKWREAIHVAEVLYEDPALDFAVVRIGVSENPYFNLNPEPVRLGDEFSIYGFPDSNLNGYSINRTSGAVASLTGFRDDKTRFRIDAVIHPGNSGGPVVQKGSDQVIGIATEGTNDVNNCAVKISEIADELSDYLPARNESGSEADLEDSVVHLFVGRDVIEEPDDSYAGCTYEEMCEKYVTADSSEKWEIFNACRRRDWPNPY